MRNVNTMGKFQYIIEHAYWMCLAMFSYRIVFFKDIPFEGIDSKAFLWLMTLLMVAVGCYVSIHKRRNDLTLFVNVVIPFEVYTALSYAGLLPRLVWGTVTVSCTLALAFLFLALTPDNKYEVSFGRRLRHGLMGSRTLIAFPLFVLMGVIWVKLTIGNVIISTEPSQVPAESKNTEWTIASQVDTVLLLQEERWSELNIQEKLEVLGVILKIEENYLGLTWNLKLKSADLQKYTLAEYDHFSKEILVDFEHLQSDPSTKVLNSICHECYHSYQHQVLSLFNDTAEEYKHMLLFERVDAYLDEFSNYENGENGIENYYAQVVEVEARQYASRAVDEYFERIAELTV